MEFEVQDIASKAAIDDAQVCPEHQQRPLVAGIDDPSAA